jgi:predicted dehydrogenase
MAGTKQDTLKIGVIGAGNMGGTHARCWNRLPGARVMAIADPQTGKAKALAAHLIEARTNGGPAPAVLGGADELIAHADVDVVSVCVPTHLHRPVVEAALRAGKHVLCEKPMALTLADCDVMLKAAKQSGTVFTVGRSCAAFPSSLAPRRWWTRARSASPLRCVCVGAATFRAPTPTGMRKRISPAA